MLVLFLNKYLTTQTLSIMLTYLSRCYTGVDICRVEALTVLEIHVKIEVKIVKNIYIGRKCFAHICSNK